MTTIELLGMQHADVLTQLTSVEATLATNNHADLSAFATYLEHDIAQHFTIEEDALFPLLERSLGLQQGPLAVMLAEHEEFRALVQALRDAVQAANHEAQRVHARAVIELLRGHIAKEDHVLFPMALRILNADELVEVDRRAGDQQASAAR